MIISYNTETSESDTFDHIVIIDQKYISLNKVISTNNHIYRDFIVSVCNTKYP